MGKDGRAIKGHVDDYWIAYGSIAPDPFIGHWTEHVQGECTGDFMGTNQSRKSNTDGSTMFYFYPDGTALYDYPGEVPEERDGCHGMKLFFESRGYTVTGNYTQLIMGSGGNTLGFTFAQYRQEIDAGRPVLIQVEGHSMLGYGYNDTGSLIYLHNTWDYSDHSMTWGGVYEGMQQWGVTVFIPSPPPIMTGDVNGDGNVNLADAILCLQVLSGLAPDNISLAADVNGDGKIGIAEAIYAIQKSGGL